MRRCKKSRPTPIIDIADPGDTSSIEWGKDVLEKCEEKTSPEFMTNLDNGYPLENAFMLSSEIKNLKDRKTEMRRDLKGLIRKTKKFTVDLLDACETQEDVGAILNFDENDLDHKQKVKTLKEAVAAKHKEVSSIQVSIELWSVLAHSIVNYLQTISVTSRHRKKNQADTNQIKIAVKLYVVC